MRSTGSAALSLVLVAASALIFSAPADGRARVRTFESKLQGSPAPYPTILRPRRPDLGHVRDLRALTARIAPSPVVALRGEVVIGLVGSQKTQQVLDDYGIRDGALEPALRAVRVRLDEDSARLLAAKAAADPRIRYIEPVVARDATRRRNDPLTYVVDPATGVPYQWSFKAVGADRTLNVTLGSPLILVGVVDSGVSDIPDLQGKVAERWYYPSQAPDASDPDGHGTFVASTIAANNDDGVGLAGFCGACRLIVLKDIALTSFSVAAAFRKLTDQGVRVLNASFGGPGFSFVEADAVLYAMERGVLIVAAAGNDGSASIGFPAAYVQPSNGALGYGLSVGASGVDRARAWFSSWGERLSMLAPGTLDGTCETGVLAGMPVAPVAADGYCGRRFVDSLTGGRYRYANGTSFSAPIVAGIAALVWSARPELRNHEIAHLLQQTAARDGSTEWNQDRGWGVLDAAAAVERATGRSASDLVRVGSITRVDAARPGRVFRVRAFGTWGDGTPVAPGNTLCDGRLGRRRLPLRGATFSAGRMQCTWMVPRNATAQSRVTGSIGLEDEDGNSDSRAFSYRVRVKR